MTHLWRVGILECHQTTPPSNGIEGGGIHQELFGDYEMTKSIPIPLAEFLKAEFPPPSLPAGMTIGELEQMVHKYPTTNKRAAIGCQVYRTEYDHKTGVGKLFMKPSHCCDMSACIKLFTILDEDVAFIYAFSGECLDIIYVKLKNESNRYEWVAFPFDLR